MDINHRPLSTLDILYNISRYNCRIFLEFQDFEEYFRLFIYQRDQKDN